MKYNLKVTKEILKQSADNMENGMKPSEGCAIVTAIRTIFPNATMGIMWTKKRNTSPNEWYMVSREIQEYAVNFDKGTYEDRIDMPEFEFTIKDNL